MSGPVRTADSLLSELRSLATLQYGRLPDLLSADRRGNIDGAWQLPGNPLGPQWLPVVGRNLDTDQRAIRLGAALRIYAVHPDRDRARLAVNPVFSRCVEVSLAPDTNVCPQCGANDGDGEGKLDGLLERWHDPTGSGWQCHNPSCQWHSQDGEIE